MAAPVTFADVLRGALQPFGIAPDCRQVAGMERHLGLLLAANARVNLTRITTAEGAAVRHFADSLVVLAWLQARGIVPQQVLDVGTGGGFPALPLALMRPAWAITAIDGTAKKTACVQEFAAQLGLTNCTILHCRAESWAAPPPFDLVLLRAVGALANCLQWVRNACCPGAVVVCYKTAPLPGPEAAAARRGAVARAFEHLEDWPYVLTDGGTVLRRQLCCYRRLGQSP